MVLKAVARKGDPTTGGGVILGGAETFSASGAPVATMGDVATCQVPGHPSTVRIVEASNLHRFHGRGMAYDGCMLSCGCRVMATSQRFRIEVSDPGMQDSSVQVTPTSREVKKALCAEEMTGDDSKKKTKQKIEYKDLYARTTLAPEQPKGVAGKVANLDRVAIKVAEWEIEHNPGTGLINLERGGFIVDGENGFAVPGPVMQGLMSAVDMGLSLCIMLSPVMSCVHGRAAIPSKCTDVSGQNAHNPGIATKGLSTRQMRYQGIAHHIADQLISRLRKEDALEVSKSWYFAGALGFDAMVEPLLRDKGTGLVRSLKGLGCRNDREMRWFMARLVHLRLAGVVEPLNDMLALVREQIKNIDDAWSNVGKAVVLPE